jgi:tRNA (guanine37-N1)-methyltransferase
MRIDVVTLFPGICSAMFGESMMRRAQSKCIVELRAHNLRDWATDKHRITDDAPYGGGQGMVMKPEPYFAAVHALREPETKVILMSPAGDRFDQQKAEALARERRLIILCGHYEGVDQRVADHLVDEEISIGDYVLTNGAIAANVVVDAVTRLIPGVLGDEDSAADDSFSRGSLEFPQYTRPVEFLGWRVPDVLLSGDHGAIARWRQEQALAKTRARRPDLLRQSDAGGPVHP